MRNEIRTWTGRYVNPLDMKPDDVDIVDIAHALSLTCRYGGHSYGHYSVAHHSIVVASHLSTRGPLVQLTGLLHDAAEAYLGDVPAPMKQQPEMAGYRAAEDRLERVLADVFGSLYPFPPEVHLADQLALRDELSFVFSQRDGDARRDERDFLALYYRLREAA